MLLKPSAAEDNARLGFTGLGTARASFEFADISLRTAGSMAHARG